MEDRGGRYRVRYRRSGHIITDSTHAGRDDAVTRAAQLDHASRAMRQLYPPAPAPRLDDWVTT
ncbi:hypothetical protein ACFY36_19455 [Actinoplanes sp. NPDC000266]